KGFIVNKFRGDVTLFANGTTAIEERTGLRSFGVLPHLREAAQLPQEDSMNVPHASDDAAKPIRVFVPRLPRISNFDDLDPLAAEPIVSVSFVQPGTPLPADADLVVLP